MTRPSNQMFKVGVIDNKTPRDGYAQYVCQVLTDKGLKGNGTYFGISAIAAVGKCLKAKGGG